MNIKRSFVVTIALLLVGHLDLYGATIIFRDGDSNEFVNNYNGTSDTSLASNTAARNGGGMDYFSVGRNFSRRSIIRFDLSSLTEAFGTVESASLELYKTGTTTTADLQIAVYLLSSANSGWSEGTGTLTADATAGEVTWSHRVYSSAAWAGSAGAGTSGTDYIATPLSTFTWTASDTSVSINLSADLISAWIANPSTNAGLIFIPLNGSGVNGITANFASSEHATEALRPTLTINYEAIPEPGTWALAVIGLTLSAMGRSFRKK